MSDSNQGRVKISDSVRITIRISAETYRKLDELIKSGGYKSLSEVIRSALIEFLSAKFPAKNVGKIMIDIPKNNLEQIKQLVEAGDALSTEEEIRIAIREYLNRRFKELARARLDKELFKPEGENES